jgi:hypothetical protein
VSGAEAHTDKLNLLFPLYDEIEKSSDALKVGLGDACQGDARAGVTVGEWIRCKPGS